MKSLSIPVYVINLKIRTDRKKHIEKEFSSHPEFDLKFIEAVPHLNGAIGLWRSMTIAICDAIESHDDYIIICEDDHQFTSSYNFDLLRNSIEYSIDHNVDILHAGASHLDLAVQVNDKLFWINQFRATQFFVAFKSIFPKIINSPFNDNDTSDGKLSYLSTSTLIIYPFISTQKEFGYSDVLPVEYRRHQSVTSLFENTQSKLTELYSVAQFYKK